MTDLPEAAETARLFHETYERLAPDFGYRTREASAKPWADVPEQNRALMIATCAEVGAHIRVDERARVLAEVDAALQDFGRYDDWLLRQPLPAGGTARVADYLHDTLGGEAAAAEELTQQLQDWDMT